MCKKQKLNCFVCLLDQGLVIKFSMIYHVLFIYQFPTSPNSQHSVAIFSADSGIVGLLPPARLAPWEAQTFLGVWEIPWDFADCGVFLDTYIDI